MTIGYNIKELPQILELPQADKQDSQSNCFSETDGKPCDLFGYSISLADQGTYIGSPGKDKGKGAVYTCAQSDTQLRTECTKMTKDNPDKGTV